MRTVKDILRKENDPAKALLAYRSTPLASGYSPAQLLMGRNIKSSVPTNPDQLMPQIVDRRNFKEKEEAGREYQKRIFDNRHKVQEMKPLSTGTTVFITDMKCRGKFVQKANTPRSYLVNTSTAVVRTNRSQLRTIPDNPVDQDKGQTTSMLANNRPHRIKKLSLKARENLGLE